MSTLIVTRAKHQSNELVEALRAHHHDVIEFPCIEIKDYLAANSLETIFQDLNQFDFTIFTSRNAVDFSLQYIHHHWPNFPPQLRVIAIGEATRDALNKASIPVHSLPEHRFNSEGLLRLSELRTIKNKKILVINGLGGRQLLQETLRARGATVSEANVYQRCLPQLASPPPINAWQQRGIDSIIVMSNETIDNLCQLIPPDKQSWLHQQGLIVISKRMADHARQHGFTGNIIIANNADNEAIVEAVEKKENVL